MSLICSKSIPNMSQLSNETGICGNISYFSGIINDRSENIISNLLLTAILLFFLAVFQETGRGFLGTFGR